MQNFSASHVDVNSTIVKIIEFCVLGRKNFEYENKRFYFNFYSQFFLRFETSCWWIFTEMFTMSLRQIIRVLQDWVLLYHIKNHMRIFIICLFYFSLKCLIATFEFGDRDGGKYANILHEGSILNSFFRSP